MEAVDPLRVAFFAGSYEHILDGVVLTSNRQVAYLDARRVPVRVFAPTNGKPLLKASGDFCRVPSIGFPRNPYRLAIGLAGKPRWSLERFRPNLVHLATPDWLGLSALRWAKRKRVPVVATFHTHVAGYLKHYRLGVFESLCWRYLRWFYGRCDEVYVACDSTAGELRSHGVTAKFVVNPFGVEIGNFSPTKRSYDWRRKHGFADDDLVIAFVSRLVWEKGLRALVRTIRRLEARGVPHRLLIVGEGPAGDVIRGKLTRAVFTGRLSGYELAMAYASADIFFFPSASETFGCVTVEALASGLPCVVADGPGSRDIVRHDIDGFVCPPSDSEAFSLAIAQLIGDSALRARLAANAIERSRVYSWEVVLREMLSNFRRAAQRPFLS